VLDAAYVRGLGVAGFADPFLQFPVLSAAVVAFNMTAPMVAWMRFRGMEWRPIAEMSAAMVAEAVLLVVAYRVDRAADLLAASWRRLAGP
jgi:hypothetical protein